MPKPKGIKKPEYPARLERRKSDQTLRESEEQWRTVVTRAMDGIITIDEKGDIRSFNPAAEIMFGYGADEAVGKNIRYLMPEPDQSKHSGYMERYFSTHQPRIMGVAREVTGQRKDGSHFFLEISISEMIQKNQHMFIGIVRDITERKCAETEITDTNESLQKEIVERRRAEQALQREHALVLLNKDVAEAANEASTFEAAAQMCLDKVCAFTGWPAGHVYLRKKNSGETLAVPSTIWSLNDPERFKSFKEVTEAACFKLGEELPGRILSSGKPLWIQDVTKDSNFPRTRLARDITVKAAFGFPALRGKEVAAVLEFFAEDALEPDESLLAVMAHIGTALGRVLERQQAEAEIRASKNRFRNIFDHSNDMIFIVDPARDKILDINAKACSTLGYSRKELLSQRISDIHPSDLSKLMDFFNLVSAENKGKTGDFSCRAKSGTLIPAEISASLVDIAGTDCLLALVRDVTERKRTEAELKQYADNLEKTNATLQDFTFTASHDLQEPLRKIISFGDRLKTLSGERLQGPELACLERIQGSTFRMKELIDDLLEYSRLSANTAAFAPVDLKEVVEKAISDLEVMIQEAKGTVNVGDLPVLEADKLQMWQLFQNLISNGIKYSKPNEPPVISIKSILLQNGFWEIHVEDNGIGFEEKYQDLIFKPFERLHPHGKFRGSGMGLAICGKIVDRHKGTIAAQGKLNRGALFAVTLPEKQCPVDEVEEPVKAPPQSIAPPPA